VPRSHLTQITAFDLSNPVTDIYARSLTHLCDFAALRGYEDTHKKCWDVEVTAVRVKMIEKMATKQKTTTKEEE